MPKRKIKKVTKAKKPQGLKKKYPHLTAAGLSKIQAYHSGLKEEGAELYRYKNDDAGFISYKALHDRLLYFPLSGGNEDGMKSCVSPALGGDMKIDSEQYFGEPVSREDLRKVFRNFWVNINGKALSLAEGKTFWVDKGIVHMKKDGLGYVEAGQLWHKLVRLYPEEGIEIEVTNIVPKNGRLELMDVRVTNLKRTTQDIETTTAIPIYGHQLEREHNHRQVTSLINEIKQTAHGVMMQPSMAMSEENGHYLQKRVYYVLAVTAEGGKPEGTIPTTHHFLGDGTTLEAPMAVLENRKPTKHTSLELNGKEAIGAIRFKKKKIKSGESMRVIIAMGIGEDEADTVATFKKYNSGLKFDKAFKALKEFWREKAGRITFKTGDKQSDLWIRWVTIQPLLRKIFGCSFLPDHDYGKGGRGWRDLWQDLLSLILIEPEHAREQLVAYFGGVRLDGTNATIIGAGENLFKPDRDGISRVWMDHGAWPLMTLFLYINQTGDFGILSETSAYFKDKQVSRARDKDRVDEQWTPAEGKQQKDIQGRIYKGTIIEHILIQHLVQFLNVGDFNNIRQEGAGWNDAFDRAGEKGENVAFTSLYAGNLMDMAMLLEKLAEKKGDKILLGREILLLLDTVEPAGMDYYNVEAKREVLKKYFAAVEPRLSGETVEVDIPKIAGDLRTKAAWIFQHIDQDEKVDDGKGCFWFNGYRDNQGRQLEGKKENGVWMTLTGVVFVIMSGMADRDEIRTIIKGVNKYLRHGKMGGFMLNTDFVKGSRVRKDDLIENMGRAFSFAFGTKENGAFFSHMIVMYMNALYKRGFVREGYDVLASIIRMHTNSSQSKIYPGIAEYIDLEGRGYYHYLTGAASWLLLTLLTQVFGVRGENGDLVLEPKLVKKQFAGNKEASVRCKFAGKELEVVYVNQGQSDFGHYEIDAVFLNNERIDVDKISSRKILISREKLVKQKSPRLSIKVVLKNF